MIEQQKRLKSVFSYAHSSRSLSLVIVLTSWIHIMENSLVQMGEIIDQLITLDISMRGVIRRLYSYARNVAGMPLTLAAAQALDKAVAQGDVVFIATGWLDRPHISLNIAETDGPPGAVVLARTLHRAFNAVPCFLVEESLLAAMNAIAQAAGFKVLPPEAAVKAVDSAAPIHAASVISFPTDLEDAAQVSRDLIQVFQPAVVIAIEKGGMNSQGYIYTSRAADSTEHLAKIDLLVKEAMKSEVITIGIGDAGNEIGMGLIREGIAKSIPFGELIAPATETDYLVTATVSNWGAYGVAACLAIILRQQEIFHSDGLENRILRCCADVGLIDGMTGLVEDGADGLPAKTHMAVVTLLSTLVREGIRKLGDVDRK